VGARGHARGPQNASEAERACARKEMARRKHEQQQQQQQQRPQIRLDRAGRHDRQPIICHRAPKSSRW
jgi:hypothetical protein